MIGTCWLVVLVSLLAGDAGYVTVCGDGGAGAYEAFPDVCRLADGRILCVFYASYAHVGLPQSEHPRGGRIVACISSDEGRTWSSPALVYDGLNDDRDPSVVQLADGRLICNFFVLKPGTEGRPYDGDGAWMVESTDLGGTWSSPRLIAAGAYCSAPIRVHSSGRLILGLYREGPQGATGCVVSSDDAGRTWSPVVDIPNAGRRLDAETDVIELRDQRLYAVQRAESGDMAWSISSDRGQTWSESKPTGFPGHCPCLLRAAGDILLLAHRLPTTSVRWSTDEGATWSDPVVVDETIGAYPSMVNLRDESVLVVYYEEGAGSNIRGKRFRATPRGIEWLSLRTADTDVGTPEN